MEFLGKFGELEWTVSEVAFMGQLFHMMANFCKRCEVYLAMDGADFEDTWDNYDKTKSKSILSLVIEGLL